MKKIVCSLVAGVMISCAGGTNLLYAQPGDHHAVRASQQQDQDNEKCKPPNDKSPECRRQGKDRQPPPPPQDQSGKHRQQDKDRQPPPPPQDQNGRSGQQNNDRQPPPQSTPNSTTSTSANQ